MMMRPILRLWLLRVDSGAMHAISLLRWTAPEH
jgi:hypothetical protein